jgi:hypothetical protein
MKVHTLNKIYNNQMNMKSFDELKVLVFEEQNTHEFLNQDNASKKTLIRFDLIIFLRNEILEFFSLHFLLFVDNQIYLNVEDFDKQVNDQ